MCYLHFLLFLWFVSFSCTENPEDLNKNPNQPEAIDAWVWFTSAIRSNMNASVMKSFLIGNNAAQLTSKPLRTEVDIYAWNPFPMLWFAFYAALANMKGVIE